MPKNKKENFIFACMMALGMVLGMSSYNTYLRAAGFEMFPINAVREYFMALPIALIIGSPLSKKLTSMLWPRQLPFAVGMGFFTPVIMVPIMTTVIAIVFYQNYALEGTLQNMLQNFLCAWPLQLLIVGPLVRKIFRQLIS